MRIALKVCYDGRGFAGSQRQPKMRTVEGELINALERLNIQFRDFKAAGRTDRGVSALGNVFALTSDSGPIKPRILNATLPDDIKVLATQRVKEDFNPRHAKERTYKYFLFDRGYDPAEMKMAAALLKGEKSFHNFSSTDYRSPMRRVNNVDIQKKGDIILIELSGESFLWQMVRRIVSGLKMVGRGELTTMELEKYFDLNYRKKMPPSDAENLVLWDVKYDFEFKDEEYSKKRLITELEKGWIKAVTESVILEEALREFK